MTTIDLVPDQRPRPTLERNPAAAATRTTQAQGGRYRGANRVGAGAIVFLLRAGPALAAAASPGARRGQSGHLLAAPAGLAAGRGLGAAAASAAGLAGRRRPGRLVPGRHRLGQRPGAGVGKLTGANPVDRFSASRCRLKERRSGSGPSGSMNREVKHRKRSPSAIQPLERSSDSELTSVSAG